MDKRRVALLCAKQLLGESLEHLLRGMPDVELLGPWRLESRVLRRLEAGKPEIILLAVSGDAPHHGAQLIGCILEQFPDVPLLQVNIDSNVVRLYSAQILPARSQALFDLIRSLPPCSRDR
jgi:hypothetical protein